MSALPAGVNTNLMVYRAGPSPPPRDIAQEAYRDAVQSLRIELQDDEGALRILESQTSAKDFKNTVETAKATYESKHPTGKCAATLRKLSSRIMYYSKVLDMLSQHHPEYVALAWGSGIINHEKLLVHFSHSLVLVGNALKGTKLSADLYPNDQMKETISHLYVHIILFFQQAVKWYTRSRVGRIVSAILNPVELNDTVQQIQSCAETVKELASAASRNEIRDVHVLLQLQQNELQSMKMRLEHIDKKTTTNLQVVTSTQALTSRISSSVADMQPRIYDIQFSKILDALAPAQSPSSSLANIYSITTRASMGSVQLKDAPSTSELLAQLDCWITTPGSRMLVVRVGLRAETEAKKLAADVVTLLEQKEFPVFFTISRVTSSKSETQTPPSLTSVLKLLVFQALKRFPTSLISDVSELNATKFATDHSEAEWKSLFFKIFSKIPRCFLIIEAQDLAQAHINDAEWVAEFTAIWQELVEQAESDKRSIKILAVSHKTRGLVPSKRECADDDGLDDDQKPARKRMHVSTIEAPVPVPPRLRKRLGATSQTKVRFFQSLKPVF